MTATAGGGETAVRVLLADGHSLFREALVETLENDGRLKVVADARDGWGAVREAVRTEPDVAVLDADLSDCDGFQATRRIRERVPDCRVLLVAAEENEGTLAAAIHAGASGFLTKVSPLSELVEAVLHVNGGETLIPTRMLGGLLDRLLRRARTEEQAAHRISRLTAREREVLALLAQGGDNESIGRALVISPQTARTHIQNVLVKLQVHSRLEAAAIAVQNGLVGEGSEPTR
jgi:two-component system, NarL family, response regulator LiaR